MVMSCVLIACWKDIGENDMKKIITVIVSLGLIIALSGCGNMSLGLGTFTFNKVHIDTKNTSGCFTIEKWYDNERGIEVKTKEAGAMYLSEGTYMLFTDKCPLCSGEKGGAE